MGLFHSGIIRANQAGKRAKFWAAGGLMTTPLDHGLQVMLDLLTGYLGNNATRTEWMVEIQKRFTGRDGKLRRGWSDDRIDLKIRKLEAMGLISGGRGRGQ